jgi:hypothetical protein
MILTELSSYTRKDDPQSHITYLQIYSKSHDVLIIYKNLIYPNIYPHKKLWENTVTSPQTISCYEASLMGHAGTSPQSSLEGILRIIPMLKHW